MTATRDVTIWCDGIEQDGHECPCWDVGNDAREVRSALTLQGWLVGLPNGRDLCPAHRDQLRDEHKIGDNGRLGT